MKKAILAARTAAATLAVAAAMPSCANADSTTPTYIGMTDQDVGVMDRARPAYDAKGIPLGAFRLFPSLQASASYDDNVFRTHDAASDWFFTLAPEARLKSQWGRHFFEIYSGLENYNYSKYTNQNLTDWDVGGDGRLDVSSALTLAANASYGQTHELWSSPNSTGFQAAPNRYWITHVDSNAVYQPNRLGFSVAGNFDHYNFTPTPAIGGGFLINDDRDNSEYQASIKTFYDFSPGYSGYLRFNYDERDFDQFLDRSGLHRSSHGYRVDGGLNLQISHLVSGEIYLGYLQQNFQDPKLKNVSGLDYGVGLDWYASPVLTVHLTGKRSLDNVVLAGISIADDKNVAVSADYEFRPNILLHAHVSYTDSSYVGSSRTDSYPGAGLGIEYLMNHYASLNLNYNYSSRSTNSSSVLEYTDNTVSIGLTLHI